MSTLCGQNPTVCKPSPILFSFGRFQMTDESTFCLVLNYKPKDLYYMC